MDRNRYAEQVRLLVRLLPFVAEEKDFALKGGTAINLFYRDLPRLSVDIDLTFLPVKDRAQSLAEINAAMDRLAAAMNRLPDVSAKRIPGGGGGATRVVASSHGAGVKIETSPVTRGVVFTPDTKRVAQRVEQEFGFAEAQIVAFEDLYGGKFNAALDRQHPRDLFDIKLLSDNEGLTDDLFRAFLVYVASSSRPPHEFLDPRPAPLKAIFQQEFAGMTMIPISVEDLEEVRTWFIRDIRGRLTGATADFLRSLQSGDPDFNRIDLPDAASLPAVLWKVQNIRKLIATDPDKHRLQSEALEALFG